MNELHWRGSGPEFTLNWCGRPWTLLVDGERPGLCHEEGEERWKLLSLDRLAAPFRCDHEAFSAKSLVAVERYRASVRATFAPPGWSGLEVRASWSVAAGDSIDLEVQVSASSVGKLDGLEVGVESRFESDQAEDAFFRAVRVEPRDAGSAGLTYDGREPLHVLRGLTTLPVAGSLSPSLFPSSRTTADLFYAEMAHPDDVSRRITGPPDRRARYALFGYALEKGVILRARLRGCWIRSTAPEADADVLYRAFLKEPLPLGP